MKQHHVESLAKEDYLALYLEASVHVDCEHGTSSWTFGEKKQEAEPTPKRHYIRDVGSIQVPQNIEFDFCFFGRLWKFFWHDACKVHELHKGWISISKHNVSVY